MYADTNVGFGRSAIVRRGAIVKGTLGYLAITVLLMWGAASWADDYSDTVALFKNAGASSRFFNTCYGYAVFPTIGSGALIVGGAHGDGRVYAQGAYVGDVAMTQVSVGFQAGGKAYSQIIFFQDKRAFDEFTSGNFQFDANASAVAITAAAGAGTGTTGSSTNASGGMKDAVTAGNYYRGMAVFTIVKGGAMASAAIGGQKFRYTPKSS
jgi:lipid-binding SYLF domain-containing protein